MGFAFVQVNTNGLRLGREPEYLQALARAGLASIFLQFDAVDDWAYEKLRGRALLAEKLRAIESCARQGIGVVLVPTILPGVNLDQVGPILELAMQHSPTVRGVHFQPMSRFGRYPTGLGDDDRLTLPELIQAIDRQSEGRFPAAGFRPPGCENSLCSFQGNFLLLPDGRVQALSQAHDPTCCPAPEPAEQGALRTIARVVAQLGRARSGRPAPDQWLRRGARPRAVESGPVHPDGSPPHHVRFGHGLSRRVEPGPGAGARLLHPSGLSPGQADSFLPVQPDQQRWEKALPAMSTYPRTPLHAWLGRKMGLPAGREPDAESLAAYQLAKLRHTVSYVRQRSPFYRQHLGRASQLMF